MRRIAPAPVPGSRGELVNVLDFDPDLAPDAAADPSCKKRSLARLLTVHAGEWEYMESHSWSRLDLGALVVEGLLGRRVSLDGRTSMELVGSGDLLRPWTYVDQETPGGLARGRWEALVPSSVAVLDAAFARRMQDVPELTAGLLDRAVSRARSLSYQVFILSRPRVDDRVLMMLWHLAERWGTVTPDGIVIEIPRLSHARLAQIVGAHRPSVSSSLGRLRRSGAVSCADDGRWILSHPQADPASPAGQPVRSHTPAAGANPA